MNNRSLKTIVRSPMSLNLRNIRIDKGFLIVPLAVVHRILGLRYEFHQHHTKGLIYFFSMRILYNETHQGEEHSSFTLQQVLSYLCSLSNCFSSTLSWLSIRSWAVENNSLRLLEIWLHMTFQLSPKRKR